MQSQCSTKASSGLIVSEKLESLGKVSHIYRKETICEVHRRIYDKLVIYMQSQPKALRSILADLEIAYDMGLSLCHKLVEYKLALPEWKDNTSQEGMYLRRLRKQLMNKLQSKLKVVIVHSATDPKLVSNAYSHTYRDMFKALINRFDAESITKPCSASDIDADVIIFFDVHSSHHIEIDGIKNHNAVKYEYFNDPHQKDFEGYYQGGIPVKKLGAKKRCKRAARRGVQFIICPYKNGFETYIKPHTDAELVWFPVAPRARSIRLTKLDERERRVLCHGHTWAGENGFHPYEFRRWAYNQPTVTTFQHYTQDKTMPRGQQYQTFLAYFAGAVALCDSYVVPKYLEIPMAGCLCFAQHQPEYEEMGFIDGTHCIYVNKDNFNDRIKEFLANPTEYQPIADAGRNLALQWSDTRFADYIYDHAERQLNGK